MHGVNCCIYRNQAPEQPFSVRGRHADPRQGNDRRGGGEKNDQSWALKFREELKHEPKCLASTLIRSL